MPEFLEPASSRDKLPFVSARNLLSILITQVQKRFSQNVFFSHKSIALEIFGRHRSAPARLMVWSCGDGTPLFYRTRTSEESRVKWVTYQILRRTGDSYANQT
jgi:hypothetical protein